MQKKYYEDIPSDLVVEHGDYLMTEEEIIRFARDYDPQPFHTEPNPPPGSGFNKLIASGWHTAAVAMRIRVDHWISKFEMTPSPGLDELRFHRPVFPGDRLRVRTSILKRRISESKPDRGIVNFLIETLNQKDEVVLSYKSIDFVKVRPA